MGLGSCIVSANQWFATTRVRRLLLPFLSLTGSLSYYTLLAVILLRIHLLRSCSLHHVSRDT